MFSNYQGLVDYRSQSVLDVLKRQVIINNDMRGVCEFRGSYSTVLFCVLHTLPSYGVLSISWNVEESKPSEDLIMERGRRFMLTFAASHCGGWE